VNKPVWIHSKCEGLWWLWRWDGSYLRWKRL